MYKYIIYFIVVYLWFFCKDNIIKLLYTIHWSIIVIIILLLEFATDSL